MLQQHCNAICRSLVHYSQKVCLPLQICRLKSMFRTACSPPLHGFKPDEIVNRFQHLLTSMNQPWLSPPSLQSFANAIHNKGAALSKWWGFVDGTVRPICRPGRNQRIVYNGHKRVHALKVQSVVGPNGLIANLYGPVEGRRHDSAILAMSELRPQLEQYSFSPGGQALCIYGDSAYPHRIHLQHPYEKEPLYIRNSKPLPSQWVRSGYLLNGSLGAL